MSIKGSLRPTWCLQIARFVQNMPDIQFTIIEDEENQQIFSDFFSHFCLNYDLTNFFSSNITIFYTQHTHFYTQSQQRNKSMTWDSITASIFLIQKQNKKLFIILVFCFTFTQLTPSNTPPSLHVLIITQSNTASKRWWTRLLHPEAPPPSERQ